MNILNMKKTPMKKDRANQVKRLRRCVGCRSMFEKHSLIRIAKNTDGNFYVDKTGKPVGRGAYVCNNAKCVAKAAKSAGVERSFGQKDKLNERVLNTNISTVENIYEHLAMEFEISER